MFDACFDVLKMGGMTVHWQERGTWTHGSGGEIKINHDYLSAKVRIDPYAHADEEQLLNTVLHECLHALMAPLDTYRRVAETAMSKVERRMSRVAYTNADEQVVVRLTESFLPFVRDAYAQKLKENP